MDEQEYKRLRRLVLWCFFFSLALIVLAAFAGSYQLKRLNAQFTASKPTVIKETTVYREKPLQGIDGVNGSDGRDIKGDKGDSVKGDSGSDGKDGQSITPDEIATAVSAYLQANPPAQGSKGDVGPAGLVVFVQTNPITGLLECRYGTDLSWFPISECAS